MANHSDNLNQPNSPGLVCADLQALLSAIVDDELDSGHRHEVERHLAQCSPCRDLVSRTETMDALLGADMEQLAAGSVISPGFEATVLNRTVYAGRRVLAMRRWTMWSGWLAAAACLGLAMTIWALDRRAGLGARMYPGEGRVQAPPSDNVAGLEKISWVNDDGLDSDESGESATSTGADSTSEADASAERGDALALPLIDAEAGAPSDPAAIEVAMEMPAAPTLLNISGQEAETLTTASLMLTMLCEARDDTFEDVEQIRRLAESEGVLPQLAQIRAHLPEQERLALLTVEGVLLRLVRGPLNMDDVRELRDDVSRLDLPQQVLGLIQRAAPREAL